ncbi:MAG: MlaD family protein [Gordonia amarae]
MNITRKVRLQLLAFAVVGTVALLIVAISYLAVPGMLGIGKYKVTLNLAASGGLYKNSNVTYRGVTVGRVDSVKLTPEGVTAALIIDDSARIPKNLTATVRSASAIGEQYVDFAVPEQDTESDATPVAISSEILRDGSVIIGEITVPISGVIDRADEMLAQIEDSNLRTVITEAFAAFDGRTEDVQRFIDSVTLFLSEANKNSDAIVKLIDSAEPVLASQDKTRTEIASWTRDLTTVTDQLRANKPEITGILNKGPATADKGRQLFASLKPTLPLLIDNLSVTAKTLAVYHANLNQIVVIYPRLIAGLITAINSEDSDKGANVDFVASFQDPPPCTVGFYPLEKRRSPGDQTVKDYPSGMLCKVAHDSPLAVRGSRNYPCVEYPGRRASTPAECRTGYQPLDQKSLPLPNGVPGLVPKPASTTGAQGKLVPAAPTSVDSTPSVYATNYDPRTGEYTGPDGKVYRVDTASSKGEVATQWEQLITTTLK